MNRKKLITILAIETSCDETAAAVAEVSSKSQIIGKKKSAKGNKKSVWKTEIRKQNLPISNFQFLSQFLISSNHFPISENLDIRVLSNIVASQIKLHQKTGGVVPEVASRAHAEMIIPLIIEALKKTEICSEPMATQSNLRRSSGHGSRVSRRRIEGERDRACSQLRHAGSESDGIFDVAMASEILKKIDAIAVTVGPGLIGSLLVGVEAAKTLAYALNKPLIPINHVEAHIYANFIGPQAKKIKFPALCLIVSGGHTSLILMKDYGKYKVVGETLDDAAGEAFDKIAKLLGLGYPGGPAIEKAAKNYRKATGLPLNEVAVDPASGRGNRLARPARRSFSIGGEPEIERAAQGIKFEFPRPMLDKEDFSFSGLKTSVLYFTKKLGATKTKKYRNQIAAEFQKAVVDTLVIKTINTAYKYQPKTILLGGGVAANRLLRSQLKKEVSCLPRALPACRRGRQPTLLIPNSSLCTDNAAIIAANAFYKVLKNQKNFTTRSSDDHRSAGWPWQNVKADANLEI